MLLHKTTYSHMVAKIVLLTGLTATLASCTPKGGNLSNRDVWDNYDIRKIERPAHEIDQYSDQYHDNDEYYTAPSSFGCSPADIMGMGCE